MASIENYKSNFAGWWETTAGILDDSGNPCVDGALVKIIQDLSGNDKHLTFDEDKKPTYRTNQINGQPALIFNGAQYTEREDAESFDADSLTVYWVAVCNSGVGNLALVDNGTSNAGWCVWQRDSGDEWGMRVVNGAGNSIAADPNAPASLTPHVMRATFDGARLRVYRDGEMYPVGLAGNNLVCVGHTKRTSGSIKFFGGYDLLTTLDEFNGKWAALIIRPGVPSSKEDADIQYELMTRYLANPGPTGAQQSHISSVLATRGQKLTVTWDNNGADWTGTKFVDPSKFPVLTVFSPIPDGGVAERNISANGLDSVPTIDGNGNLVVNYLLGDYLCAYDTAIVSIPSGAVIDENGNYTEQVSANIDLPSSELGAIVDTGSGVWTTSGNHGLADGWLLLLRNIGGSLPSGMVEGVSYFVKTTGLSTFTLHSSYTDALEGANTIVPGDTGSGTHYISLRPPYGKPTFRWLYANIDDGDPLMSRDSFNGGTTLNIFFTAFHQHELSSISLTASDGVNVVNATVAPRSWVELTAPSWLRSIQSDIPTSYVYKASFNLGELDGLFEINAVVHPTYGTIENIRDTSSDGTPFYLYRGELGSIIYCDSNSAGPGSGTESDPYKTLASAISDIRMNNRDGATIKVHGSIILDTNQATYANSRNITIETASGERNWTQVVQFLGYQPGVRYLKIKNMAVYCTINNEINLNSDGYLCLENVEVYGEGAELDDCGVYLTSATYTQLTRTLSQNIRFSEFAKEHGSGYIFAPGTGPQILLTHPDIPTGRAMCRVSEVVDENSIIIEEDLGRDLSGVQSPPWLRWTTTNITSRLLNCYIHDLDYNVTVRAIDSACNLVIENVSNCDIVLNVQKGCAVNTCVKRVTRSHYTGTHIDVWQQGGAATSGEDLNLIIQGLWAEDADAQLLFSGHGMWNVAFVNILAVASVNDSRSSSIGDRTYAHLSNVVYANCTFPNQSVTSNVGVNQGLRFQSCIADSIEASTDAAVVIEQCHSVKGFGNASGYVQGDIKTGDPKFSDAGTGDYDALHRDWSPTIQSSRIDGGTFLYMPYDIGGTEILVEPYGYIGALQKYPLNGATSPTVTTGSVSSITTTTATVSGEVVSDGGSELISRGFVIGTSPNPEIGQPNVRVYTELTTETGAFNWAVTQLEPGTTYYVRATGINAVGTTYGDNVEFTTASIPDEPSTPNQPPTVNIASITGSRVFGFELTFVCRTSDFEYGDVFKEPKWYSNLDGYIGNGKTIQYSALRVGTHTIRVVAQDAEGATAQATTTLTITSPSVGCTSTCQTTPQVGCGLSCQTSCQGSLQASCGSSCQISCQIACEAGCQVACESSCQGACQHTCQEDCQVGCQSGCREGCEGNCQYMCQFNCETRCQSVEEYNE